jgi:hypothetical protein
MGDHPISIRPDRFSLHPTCLRLSNLADKPGTVLSHTTSGYRVLTDSWTRYLVLVQVATRGRLLRATQGARSRG